MSKGRELVKNTAIIAVGKIATQFISFLLLPLYTAVLNPEEFGTVDLLISVVAFWLPIITLQIEQGVFRYLVDSRESETGKKRLISTTVLFISATCIATLLILLVVQQIAPQQYMLFIILIILSNVLSIIVLQVARGFGKMAAYSFASFLTVAIIILFNVYFLVVAHWGVKGMLMATILGNMACFVYLAFDLKLWRYLDLKMFDKTILKELVIYSAPLVPHALSWWIVNASDRVVITLALGLSANGLIAVAHKFPSVYTSIFNIFSLSWAETGVLHLKAEENKGFFERTMQTAFNIFLSGYLLMIAILPFVYKLLVNSDYGESYQLVPIYMLSAFFCILIGLYNVIYTTYKDTKEIAKTTLAAGLINVVVILAAIRIMGVYAAPVAAAIAYGVMSVYNYFHTRKHVTIKLDLMTLTGGTVMIVITTAGYVIRNPLVCGLILLLSVCYSVFINRIFLTEAFKMLIGTFNKKGAA